MYTGLNNLGLNSISSVFSPTNLFINNEQGFLYINDLSTMYQDSAGTLPAVLEGPVGLWLDSRFGGVRGAELWNDAAVTIAANSSRISPNVYRIYSPTGAETADVFSGIGTIGQWYEVTFTVDSVTTAGSGLTFTGFASPPTFAATVGAKRAVLQASGLSLGVKRAGGITDIQVSGVSVKPLPGNHATQPTSANRPTLKQDAKGNYYVHFNGTNQWMQTGPIDFSGTDKMTVFAGVTKLSDAATSIICEASADSTVNNGAFYLSGPNNAGINNYGTSLRGDTAATGWQSLAYAAPSSNVLSASLDIAGATRIEEVTPRVNGAVKQSTVVGAAAAGAGNFGSYPVYLGARAGSSLFFNGDIYCLAARGALTTDSMIAQMEQWANGRMGRVY